MKILSKILGTILIANAVLCLGGMLSRSIHWHFGLSFALQIGLPICLLVAGVLQLIKPQLAFVVLIVMFPLASIVVHFSMLPTWLLFKSLPQSIVMPTLLTTNALVVAVSMLVWLNRKKDLHNKANALDARTSPQ